MIKDEKDVKPAADQQMIESTMIKDQRIKIANHIANRQNENFEKFLPETYFRKYPAEEYCCSLLLMHNYVFCCLYL